MTEDSTTVWRDRPYRPLRLDSSELVIDQRPDGTVYARRPTSLPAYPDRLTQRLDYWADAAPERTFVARRVNGGEWRRISYAEARSAARAIGEALLLRGLSVDRPLLILSGNDLEHALLGLGALYAGIPYSPLSPAYSLVSSDFAKLRFAVELLTPGLVFAASGTRFGAAIAAAVPHDTEIVVTGDPVPDRPSTRFDTLLATRPTERIDRANRAIGPDSIAKFLFTSGSTGLPKAVINTQRMLCSNQVILNTHLAFIQDEPPVIVDWLPWNHTFGGNHNVGLVLYNGGSLYIDEGKPTPSGIGETVRNLREIAPTIYFNVPKGFEALLPYLQREPALRETFFSRLRLNFYSGAGMVQTVWDALDQLAVETIGERILMLTGLGATESGPFAFAGDSQHSQSGNVGLPARGVEVKLAPVDGKLEARLKGPSITPGYWRQPEPTALAFDDEGYYRLGDALVFVDPGQPAKGLTFDGRIAEDFKLGSGTWVSVGPVRAGLLQHCTPYAKDAVLAGLNRDDLTALVFPDLEACRVLCPDLPADADTATLLAHPTLRRTFAQLLAGLARRSGGSSQRITRILLLDQPPSIDHGEITDKGSINQRAVLSHRAGLVDRLYRLPPPPDVIVLAKDD